MSSPALPSLVLASQSPRRAQLLAGAGVCFRVVVSAAEEKLSAPTPRELAEGNALLKAEAVARHEPRAVVLGADTVVALGTQVLGKPKDPVEARQMLESLSGQTHEVWTGLALLGSEWGKRVASSCSRIRFRVLGPEEISSYVNTREPYDKAGGYGIQGLASLFVEGVEGSYSNVVGLPLELLFKELQALTGIPPWRWVQ